MRTVSIHKSRALYVIQSNDGFWWLTTLAPNRRDCWEHAEKYETKPKLKQKGYKCVRVRLEEVS